jgi:hypothetical protein
MLGGFLYNNSDFWVPLTHGRDARLAWIEAQKTMIVENTRSFSSKPQRGHRPQSGHFSYAPGQASPFISGESSRPTFGHSSSVRPSR